MFVLTMQKMQVQWLSAEPNAVYYSCRSNSPSRTSSLCSQEYHQLKNQLNESTLEHILVNCVSHIHSRIKYRNMNADRVYGPSHIHSSYSDKLSSFAIIKRLISHGQLIFDEGISALAYGKGHLCRLDCRQNHLVKIRIIVVPTNHKNNLLPHLFFVG